jgi:hypothetical protein
MLGTHASGSTWLFNVVLALFRASEWPVFSASCDDATDALDSMPIDVGDVVLKSHSLDQRLIRVARLAGARIIVSTRDPRDSVVSQRERFGSTVKEAAYDLSKAFSTIGSLNVDLPILRFAYEDRFMDDPSSVKTIALFLGLAVSDEAIAAIHAALRPETVRKRIEERVSSLAADTIACQDPDTQWHPGHVGDGRVGKWRDHLNTANRDIVNGCLSPLTAPGLWQKQPLHWSAELFETAIGAPEQATVTILPAQDSGLFCWGPYLHLPTGRWRATPSVRHVSWWKSHSVEADVYLPWSDHQLAQTRGAIGHGRSYDLAVDFEHYDHYQPVELRLRSLVDAGPSIFFSGWTLNWLGALAA